MLNSTLVEVEVEVGVELGKKNGEEYWVSPSGLGKMNFAFLQGVWGPF